jgi:hypothetical protein
MMGGVSWRGGSWEVTKFTTITWLKMEDVCILCNVIEVFLRKKVTKVKMKTFYPLQDPNGIGTVM